MSSLRNDSREPVSINAPGELLPPFAAKQKSHLPTPQSPNDLGRYLNEGAPDSPIVHGPGSNGAQNQRESFRRPAPDANHARVLPSDAVPIQCVTPESSPHVPHSHYNTTATPRYIIPPSNQFSTPKQNSAKYESIISRPSSTEPLKQPSTLSSPFMEKASISHTPTALSPPADPPSSQQSHAQSSSPPLAAGPSSQPTHVTSVGSEMERIRQSWLEDRKLQLQEAEKRRPEYLKRAKRSTLDLEPEDDEDRPRSQAVGILESPQKGRRLALFQETSEESFEESLMAGGYGRYRTADWVRQPQPIALPVPTTPNAQSVVAQLEQAEEQPPTEKELKKRKRLEAFKSEMTSSNVKLCPVQLEGKGRVLIDIPVEDNTIAGSPEPSPSKKRLTARKKKKGIDPVTGKRILGLEDGEEQVKKPNWPDAEFPWRLRTEQRVENIKAAEEERLRLVERFLDRDTDDEDESESRRSRDATPGPIAVEAPPVYTVMGRGKMVPVRVYPHDAPATSRLLDPADAVAALLSKKSVRALSYRQQRRRRELESAEDEEVVCICRGRDDGRELVQCDGCQTWYHLECIGITNIADLGREEDPWFCQRCVRSPSPQAASHMPHSEPTFVPTAADEYPSPPTQTMMFLPSGLQDSPNWVSSRMPRTPTRVTNYVAQWSDSSRQGPHTPQNSAQSARVYTSPLDSYGHSYEDAPFDPTSTPSRGIRFNAPFTTPKNNGWSSRSHAPFFQTPSKPTPGSSHSTASRTSLDVSAPSSQQHYDRFSYDESPIRRNDTPYMNHGLYTPSRSSRTYAPFLDESPVVRSLGSQVRGERTRPA